MAARVDLNEAPFAKRSLWLLCFGAGGSLVLAFLLLVFRSDNLAQISVQSDAYSVSALGHNALVELLRTAHHPLVVSRHKSEQRAGREKLLVVAEPHQDKQSLKRLTAMFETAETVLLVLPKREGERDPENEGWLGSSSLLDLDAPQSVLRACGIRTPLLRPSLAAPPIWHSSSGLPLPTLEEPQLLDLKALEETAGDGTEVLLECAAGALLVRYHVSHDEVVVLTDPDVLENHGIGRGDNAALVLGLLDELSSGNPIVLDETLHGNELAPSVWVQLGRFPLVLLLGQLFLLFAIVLWTAAGRFGAPLPVPPAIAPGKRFLIANIADLLESAGHSGQSLRRYLRARVRATALRLHAPAGLDGDRELAWVAARRPEAGKELLELKALVQDAAWDHARARDLNRLVALARRIHATTEEIVHGRS